MINVHGQDTWFKCFACGDVSKNPLECCGQTMERYFDEEEFEEFQNYILEEKNYLVKER